MLQRENISFFSLNEGVPRMTDTVLRRAQIADYDAIIQMNPENWTPFRLQPPCYHLSRWRP